MSPKPSARCGPAPQRRRFRQTEFTFHRFQPAVYAWKAIPEMGFISSIEEQVRLSVPANAKQSVDLVRLLQRICRDLEIETVDSNCSLSFFHLPHPPAVARRRITRPSAKSGGKRDTERHPLDIRRQHGLRQTRGIGRQCHRHSYRSRARSPDDSLPLIFEAFVQDARSAPVISTATPQTGRIPQNIALRKNSFTRVMEKVRISLITRQIKF